MKTRRPNVWQWSALCLVLGLLAGVAGADSTVKAPAGPDLAAVLDLPNVKVPFPGVVVGGQPSAEHLRRAAELGIELVVDLRAPGELEGRDEKTEVEALGLNYVQIPIAGRQAFDRAAAEKLAAALAGLEDEAASSGETGPRVLVHCASGNRVGGLFALMAFYVDGRGADEALAYGEQAGLRASLRPAIEEVLASAEP